MRGPAISKVMRASKGCDSNPNSKVAAWLEAEPMRIKSADNEAVTGPNSSAPPGGARNGKDAGEGRGTAPCEPRAAACPISLLHIHPNQDPRASLPVPGAP